MALFIPILPILRPVLSGNAALPAHPWSMATGRAERYSTDRVARATPRSTARTIAVLSDFFQTATRGNAAPPPPLRLHRAGHDAIDHEDPRGRRETQPLPGRVSTPDNG